MPTEVIDTSEATITIETRPTGDGTGTAKVTTVVPKPGTFGANEEDLRGKARQALTVNATFLALSTPTNAQVVTQTQRLTRECSILIRLLMGLLDDTAGT